MPVNMQFVHELSSAASRRRGQRSESLRCDLINCILAVDAAAESEPDIAEQRSN